MHLVITRIDTASRGTVHPAVSTIRKGALATSSRRWSTLSGLF
jgi:hypothetical protein